MPMKFPVSLASQARARLVRITEETNAVPDGADGAVEAVTFLNCLDPDPAHNGLRMFWLKSRKPDVYRETTKQFVDDARKSYDVANTPEDL